MTNQYIPSNLKITPVTDKPVIENNLSLLYEDIKLFTDYTNLTLLYFTDVVQYSLRLFLLHGINERINCLCKDKSWNYNIRFNYWQSGFIQPELFIRDKVLQELWEEIIFAKYCKPGLYGFLR